MGHNVFANMREIACKASSGKSIAAFPDVVFTPPQAPPTPPGVPIPYPNTAKAGDTTKGTKKVKIAGKEVMIKNKSNLKTSIGNEAGSAPKKGILTSKNKGKAYFNSWSMNVMFEGENVVRHLDLTTHNHGSTPGNTPPWAYISTMDGGVAPTKECKEMSAKKEAACDKKGMTSRKDYCKDTPDAKECRKAKACLLGSYSQGKRSSASTSVGCCKGEQPHHLVEAHCFYEVGKRGDEEGLLSSAKKYNDNAAPCVCAAGPRDKQVHGQFHAVQQGLEAAYHKKKEGWNYSEAQKTGVISQKIVNPQCDEKCTEAQLKKYHEKECGIKPNTNLRTDPQAGTRSRGKLDSGQKKKLADAVNSVVGRKSF